MVKYWYLVSVALLLAIIIAPNSDAFEVNVDLELEGRFFTDNPNQSGEYSDDIASSLEVEFVSSFNDGNTLFNFTPFGRWDGRDSNRRHTDIRELNVIHSQGNWEFQGGISKVFWGG